MHSLRPVGSPSEGSVFCGLSFIGTKRLPGPVYPTPVDNEPQSLNPKHYTPKGPRAQIIGF